MNKATKALTTFIVCAGSRNIPLIQRLTDNRDYILIPHFDEREASFFALGLAKKMQKPVAVVCTSGTAVTECYSAVVEAHYQKIPLVIISADRPLRYRGTGAPQSIEQKNIFSSYVLESYDYHESEFDIQNIVVSDSGPVHFNICIEDRLASADREVPPSSQQLSFDKSSTPLHDFLDSTSNPLIVLGELTTTDQRVVEKFCATLGAHVYAESLSGLRESSLLDKLLIKGSERCVKKLLDKNVFDGILRIGGVPMLRAWRDIEDIGIDSLSIDSRPFSGGPSFPIICGSIAEILSNVTERKRFTVKDEVKVLDARAVRELTKLLYEFPKSEPALFYSLSHQITSNDSIFIGNSLPIREWDLAASRKTPHPLINAQRGANGIDGQLSNFFGSLDGNRHNWGIFGDLTTLYGLNAFSVLKQFPTVPISIVVINNHGGDIFRRLPSLKKPFKENHRLEELIVNTHEMSFEHVASLWNLNFEKVTTFDKPLRRLGKTLIEVHPDPHQTEKFWNVWNMFWDSV